MDSKGIVASILKYLYDSDLLPAFLTSDFARTVLLAVLILLLAAFFEWKLLKYLYKERLKETKKLVSIKDEQITAYTDRISQLQHQFQDQQQRAKDSETAILPVLAQSSIRETHARRNALLLSLYVNSIQQASGVLSMLTIAHEMLESYQGLQLDLLPGSRPSLDLHIELKEITNLLDQRTDPINQFRLRVSVLENMFDRPILSQEQLQLEVTDLFNRADAVIDYLKSKLSPLPTKPAIQ